MSLLHFWKRGSNGQDTSSDQSGTIQLLLAPDTYCGDHELARADHVDRMDTHGAVIFLAGDRAYKLKRAIKLAYLDFSTIEKRRSALENELRLNSRTAPEIYRRLLPVWRDGGGGLHLAGRYGAEAQIIDWVLEMNRFDQVNLLDRRAAEGRLDPALLEMLAGTIRGFHNISPSVPGANWPDSLRKVAETVRDALGNEAFAQLALAPSICALDDALARNDAFMRKRRRQGFVRRCHGDLHLKNIVLVEGKPRLFDALEFDEELARIDIIYDLAFLLMDLWSRGLKSEASALLNHYFMNATHGNELDGLRLMPMMMAIRAGVRAMVGLDELAVADDASRERRYSDMIGYARLFVELLTPEKPRLVAIGGLSGTGKTTIARAVSPEVGVSPGAMHVRSDVERKLLFHADMLERLSPGCYTDSATKLVYHRMFTKAEAILRAGHSVILDATFAPGQARMDLAGLAERSGVPLETIWLCADQNEMMNRVSARVGDASDADATIVARQVESIGMSEPAGWRCVEASGSRDAAIENVRRVLDDR